VNGFTSNRKRMSVLVRTPGGQARLLCKGADSATMGRLRACGGPDWLAAHLQEFADEGLRTLVVAQRDLDEEEVSRWLEEYAKARASVEERDDLLERAAEAAERELELLGATAIEDELQDGVGETLEALREAGIKIWVLTGDKLETAVNIGFSARLLDPAMRLVRVDGASPEAVLAQLEAMAPPTAAAKPSFSSFDSQRWTRAASWWGRGAPVIGSGGQPGNGEFEAAIVAPLLATSPSLVSASGDAAAAAASATNQPLPQPATADGDGDGEQQHPQRQRWRGGEEEELAMAITGSALALALTHEPVKRALLAASLACRVVLACRVSPRQKADVVRLVKRGAQSESGHTPVTLAIGDGANDVVMIQEAQVGVGISGKEVRANAAAAARVAADDGDCRACKR
jgi:magnesium-transporting ATPase (P-type)